MIIDAQVLDFLKSLTINNNRLWFQKNKELYIHAKESFESFISEIINRIAEFDKDIKGVSAKESIFRIYKDVRFSKDKLPYKNNFGAYIAKQGRKSGHAGYYIHIEPDNSFIGGGIYKPQSDVLRKIRTVIYNNPEKLEMIIKNPAFKKTYGSLIDDKLKSAPRDFDRNFKYIDLLKYKSYTATKTYNEKQIISKSYADNILKDFQVLKPFNDFLNKAF